MSAVANLLGLTFLASAALSKYRCVKLAAGKLAYAGAADRGIGVLDDSVLAADDPGAVTGYHEAAALYMTAAEAISAGALVYAAANGKIAATGTIERGVALEAATGDNQVIRVAPHLAETSDTSGTTNGTFTVDTDVGKPKMALGSQTGGTGDFSATLLPPATMSAGRSYTMPEDSHQTLVGATATQTLTNKTLTAPVVNSPVTTRKVTAKTANFDIEATDSGQTFTSVGASGTITGTLPPATVGLNYRFRVGAAQELRIDPDGSETIALPSTGVQGAAGKYLTANADGETVEIECTKAGEWSVVGFTGTWTAEG